MSDQTQYHNRNECMDCLREDNAALVEINEALRAAQPVVSPAQRAEFEALVRPLIKWLNDNWHPHVTAVVSTTHAELLEGMIGFQTTDYVRG